MSEQGNKEALIAYAVDAIALWDALSTDADLLAAFHAMHDECGYAELRERVAELVPPLLETWDHIVAYDDWQFDFEYCPAFLRAVIANPDADAEELQSIIRLEKL